MANKKGVPKRNGSGKGTRENLGRGGCKPPKNKGVSRPKKKTSK